MKSLRTFWGTLKYTKKDVVLYDTLAIAIIVSLIVHFGRNMPIFLIGCMIIGIPVLCVFNVDRFSTGYNIISEACPPGYEYEILKEQIPNIVTTIKMMSSSPEVKVRGGKWDWLITNSDFDVIIRPSTWLDRVYELLITHDRNIVNRSFMEPKKLEDYAYQAMQVLIDMHEQRS